MTMCVEAVNQMALTGSGHHVFVQVGVGRWLRSSDACSTSSQSSAKVHHHGAQQCGLHFRIRHCR
jgi:threonine dehydratase